MLRKWCSGMKLVDFDVDVDDVVKVEVGVVPAEEVVVVVVVVFGGESS